ncbi:MAG TPA: flagellar hook basal-body protein [Desulfuromonadales bacterium]|nr:flagellar hook basal-body protein [Desulfuromonadales bacterium]
MSSGFYSAVSGMVAKLQTLDTITNNMSNANTFGFKADRFRFDSLLDGTSQDQQAMGVNFSSVGNGFVDFSQGTSQYTGNPLNLAINGDGFFKVQGTVDGQSGTFYTRLGSFKVDANGNLLTTSGLKVLNANGQPITAPSGKVSLDHNGQLIDDSGNGVGTVGLFTVADQKQLHKVGDGLFTAPAGMKDQTVANPDFSAKSLEASNVHLFQQMAQMMDTQRIYDAYNKVLKTYSSLASKANGIGSLA